MNQLNVSVLVYIQDGNLLFQSFQTKPELTTFKKALLKQEGDQEVGHISVHHISGNNLSELVNDLNRVIQQVNQELVLEVEKAEKAFELIDNRALLN